MFSNERSGVSQLILKPDFGSKIIAITNNEPEVI